MVTLQKGLWGIGVDSLSLTDIFLPLQQVIVVCSEGAFKQQQSHLSGEVLNIPTSSSTFDGLFSAGLKFFQAKHAYDYDRLALARYEMLPLCAEEFRLVEMVPNRYVSHFTLFPAFA